MNKKEFATLTIGIKAAYPASKILEDTPSMDFWYMMLNDIPYSVAENAVMEHICTNIYPPNIAEIRKLCMSRMTEPVLSVDDAWGVVKSAMSKYGFYDTEKAFSTMDELTLSVVKNLGWSNLCRSENSVADRANFRMAYEAKAAEKINNRQLPQFVEEKKKAIQQQYVPALETKEVKQIETQEKIEDVRKELTEEQLAERAKMFEEVRRRILGGN